MSTTQANPAAITAFGPAGSTIGGTPVSPEEVHAIDAYWRACCYLILGMLYLRQNPLLREPLKSEHVKRHLLGHWGSSPGQSFVWAHLNRIIRKYDLNMIYVSGPGHGAPGVLAPVYLDGSYSEMYPDKSEDYEGMEKFFRQFSFHVRGYKELGNINTPFELAIHNQIDRFSIAIDVIDRVPRLKVTGAHAKEKFKNEQINCLSYAYENGIDKPEIVNWKWPYS